MSAPTEALRESLREIFVEGYLLAVEHARQRLRQAGIANCDPVLDDVCAIAADVRTKAVIAKAAGDAS